MIVVGNEEAKLEARRKEWRRAYYLRNKDKEYEKYKRYAAINRERINKRMRDWRKNNPVKNREQKQRWHLENRARYLTCRYVKDKFDREYLVEQYDLGCSYCGSKEKLELDHKHPRSRGGESSIHNLRWLCLPCNRAKHNLTEAELLVHLKKMIGALDVNHS